MSNSIAVPVWALTQNELEHEAQKRDDDEPEHAREIRMFARERRERCFRCRSMWSELDLHDHVRQSIHISVCQYIKQTIEKNDKRTTPSEKMNHWTTAVLRAIEEALRRPPTWREVRALALPIARRDPELMNALALLGHQDTCARCRRSSSSARSPQVH